MVNEIGAITAAQQSVSVERPAASGSEGFSETLKNSSQVDLDAIFEEASRRYGVPVGLLKAVARAESGFRADATSRCGAMGIMQLMPGTARSLGVTDAYDPEQNIMGGAKYLRQMLDSFDGDVQLALAAYNAGPGAVSKYGGIPPYNETQNYVKTVLGYMGSDITAGTVTYAEQQSFYTGRADTTVEQDSNTAYRESIADMLLMRIMEMQMKSGDDDKDSAYKKIF